MRRPSRSKPARPRREQTTEVIELTVERLGAQGDGIATWQDETIFLPFAVPGDRVRAALGARRAGGREARVVELLSAGSGRANPVCQHFGCCGGCTLQHLAAYDYHAVKLAGLEAALRRVGIDPAVVAPPQTVPPHRRRARLGLQRRRDPQAPAVVGFRERFRHALVDLGECPVLEPALFALMEPLRHLGSWLVAPGGTAEAMLTRCDSGIDLLIEAAAAPNLAALEALAAFAESHDLARIVWRADNTDTPVIERRPVRVVFSGIAVPFPPGGFLQASAAVEALLAAEITTAIGDREPVLDLYAGLGPFTLALAKGRTVHAVEGDAAAVAALGQAASRLRGITVERRDLDRDPLTPVELAPYAAAVFDPPRAGARRQADALATSQLDIVVAVSCNPATFARDAARLIAGGYHLERVVPIDQFVWSPHLELVATFRRS
ncbi:MAG TPA: class I SAM-dependent RNA methyltransferase [Stellaceae bacterium]|nr:class I SAM-dependent RNA methyltransferase [Stellaceae bacterium]